MKLKRISKKLQLIILEKERIKNMKKREFLNQIKNDFEKAKSDETLNQGQKNSKYASMMTSMEQRFKIPLLAEAEFAQLDNDVKDLYLEISLQRNFDIYDLDELEDEEAKRKQEFEYDCALAQCRSIAMVLSTK